MKMKKVTKKVVRSLVSIIISISMMFGSISGGVFAEETEPQNISDIAMISFGGNLYAIFDEGLTWHEAKAYCEDLGGHLVTITSQEEQNFVADLIKNGNKNHYWLGATDEEKEGTWKWVTNETFSYRNWDRFQPDNGNGVPENYLQIFRVPNKYLSQSVAGKWNDTSVDASYRGETDFFHKDFTGFICEWEANDDLIPLEFCDINNEFSLGTQKVFAQTTDDDSINAYIPYDQVQWIEGNRYALLNESSTGVVQATSIIVTGKIIEGAVFAIGGTSIIVLAQDAIMDATGKVISKVEDYFSFRQKVQEFIELKITITAIQVAFEDLDDSNKQNHILQDGTTTDNDHLWRKLVPDPRDPDNWEKIKKIIGTVMANGVEKLYNDPDIYEKTLGIGNEFVTVRYRIIEGIIRISDAWVVNNTLE